MSLCTLLDDDLVVLDLMHGRSVVEFTTRPGTRLALHASAHGKIWLAFGPESLLERVLAAPLKPWTSKTLTDARALESEVMAVRKRGWSTAPNEAVTGVNTIAAPVLDHRGVLVGSIAIVGSTQVIAPKPRPSTAPSGLGGSPECFAGARLATIGTCGISRSCSVGGRGELFAGSRYRGHVYRRRVRHSSGVLTVDKVLTTDHDCWKVSSPASAMR